MTHTSTRRAVTLTEVLIAIFLMGIGLMAILSLFPLGAAQMAQALQDQRASEAATTAAAYARVMWKQGCETDGNDSQMKFLTPDWIRPQNPLLKPQPFIMAMDDPNAGIPTSAPSSSTPIIPRTATVFTGGVISPTGPSYPVLVDPIGWQANQSVSPALQWWMGYTSAAPCIPRRTVYDQDSTSSAKPWIPLGNPFSTEPQQKNMLRIAKQFSLMDDMTFDFNGTPKGSAANASTPVERQGRYSWAFLFRRANNADRTAVDISTILYSGRSMDVASQETAYTAVVVFPTASAPGITPSTKQVTLLWSGTKPAIRRGGWVLDATLQDAAGNPFPQGIFYRVVNVDDSTAGQLVLEVQTPIIGDPWNTPTRQPTQRTFVVMDKVVDVFVKKDVTNVAPAMPY